MHILPSVTAEGFDGSHHPRYAEYENSNTGNVTNGDVIEKYKLRVYRAPDKETVLFSGPANRWQHIYVLVLEYVNQSDRQIFLNPFLNDRKILDLSKLKEFADDNSKLDENGGKLFKRVQNTVGQGEIIACYEQFLFFPQCFQKTCTADT